MGFFGSLLGKDQKNQARKTAKQSRADLAAGYGKAQPILSEMAETGGEDDAFYRDLLGLNGPEARARSQQVITSDPQFTGELASGQNAMLRYMNARGASGGGAAALAGQRVLNEKYGNWMDRYRARSFEGQQAKTNLANLEYGYGATKAGQTVQSGNAMVQAMNSGVNNVLGLVGLGVDAYSAGMKR